MKVGPRALVLIVACAFSAASMADPVPIPCDPAKNCPPIDPCKINPDRCKDKGGPVGGSLLDAA